MTLIWNAQGRMRCKIEKELLLRHMPSILSSPRVVLYTAFYLGSHPHLEFQLKFGLFLKGQNGVWQLFVLFRPQEFLVVY